MNRTCSFSTNRGQFKFDVISFCDGMIAANFCTKQMARETFKLLEHKSIETLVIDKLDRKLFVRFLTTTGKAYDYWVTAKGAKRIEGDEY